MYSYQGWLRGTIFICNNFPLARTKGERNYRTQTYLSFIHEKASDITCNPEVISFS